MVRILHLADLHLGWHPEFLDAKAAVRRRERDDLLTRAVDFALDEAAVDVVIIAGDLFETHRPDAELVQRAITELQRLVAAGVHVVTVPGNHDEITYNDSVYRAQREQWPGVLVHNAMPAKVTTLTVGETPVHIYGLAYTGGVTRADAPIEQFPRDDKPGLHVAVFHGSLDWDAGERSLPISSRGLAAAAYDYVALGHIHRYEKHRIGRGVAVYPGAVEGKGFSDAGVGHFVVTTLVPDGQPRVERYPVPVRPIRTETVDVTPFDDVDALESRIAEAADDEAIVRFVLTGAAPAPIFPRLLWEKLHGHFFFLDIVDETATLDGAAIDALAGERTVRGRFVRRLQTAVAATDDEDERALLGKVLRRGLAALEGDDR